MKSFFKLLGFCLLVPCIAQVPMDISFGSFRQDYKTKENSHTYAIVIGLSRYMDSTLTEISSAQRDAQAFAVWLQSRSGGAVPANQIVLLVNEQATLAQVIQAINDQSSKCMKGDQLLFYFSGYASGAVHSRYAYEEIFFYDTPFSSGQSGSHQIVRQFSDLVRKMHRDFQYYGVLYPIPGEKFVKEASRTELRKEVFDLQFSYTSTVTGADSIEEARLLTKTLNHHLLDGLHGLADMDQNGEVQFKELRSYFESLHTGAETAKGSLFVAASGKKLRCAVAQQDLIGNHSKISDVRFPGIFYLDGLEHETEIIQAQNDSIKKLYQDFLVALRLGQLMPPDAPNATLMYEQLIANPQIKELHNELRRRLIVRLLDESQQAINAYLNLDPSEWMRRMYMQEKYLRYPKYIEKANQLLGNSNFMSVNLKSKQYYFEGLNKRFEAIAHKDSSLLRQALELQQKALDLESESAFIENEMGTIWSNLKNGSEAIRHYERAMNISPAWSIPYVNMGIQLKGSPNKALAYLQKALQLNPASAFAYNNMGIVYMEQKQFELAEEALIQAITLEPRYADAFYNLACVRSLQNETESAIGLLERAFYLGLKNLQHVQADPDLKNVRNAPGYAVLIKKYFPD